MRIHPKSHCPIFLIVIVWGAFVFGGRNDHTVTGQEPGEESRESIREQAPKLIQDLGSDQYAKRKIAQEQLAEFLPLVVDLLQKESSNADPEIAARIKLLLKKVPKSNLFLMDALGDPIPFGSVMINGEGIRNQNAPLTKEEPATTPAPVRIAKKTYSDSSGGIGLEEFESGQVECVFSHQDFGRARFVLRFPLTRKKVTLPLVANDSPALKRAVRGTVKDSAGNPVVGAAIRGWTVRTPGQGLIQGEPGMGEALTDPQGKFRFYLPNRPTTDRGKLIPLNSNYKLQVSMPEDSRNIPVGGRFNNQDQAEIVFSLSDRVHRFTFESIEGTKLSDEQLAKLCTVTYRGEDGNEAPAKLDVARALKGVKLKNGIYHAHLFYKSKLINLQPIKVTAASREELVFRIPPEIEYRGRIIHGITRNPLANAVIFAYSATKQGSLASLTEKEWESLSNVPLREIRQSKGFDRINEIYSVQAITRTNEQGEFSIIQPPTSPAYGLIAIGKDFIPYGMSNYHLVKRSNPFQHQVRVKSLVKEFPLFPAGKVFLKPVLKEKELSDRSISILPVWQIKSANQPGWIDQLMAARNYKNGEFKFDSWLEHNKTQAVLVPAGVNLVLKLEAPYNEFISPTIIKKSINIEQGEVKKIGEVRFQRALKIRVKVVDEFGAGVEGLPVRRMYVDSNAWSLVHNTDAAGEVTFGLDRNSRGKFRVGESFPGNQQPKPIYAEFKIADSEPETPIVIKVTTKQIEEMRKQKRPRR